VVITAPARIGITKMLKESNMNTTPEVQSKIPPREFTYDLDNVCAKKVAFDITDGRLHRVFIHLGCEGHRACVSKLLEGMSIDEAILRMKGIKCNGSTTKNTSCADSIARVLIKHKKLNQKPTPEEQLDQLQGQVSHLTDVVLALEGTMKEVIEIIGSRPIIERRTR